MTTTNTGAPDAIVHSDSPFGFRVSPPVVSKHASEVFTILNATGVTVHVSFPVLPANPSEADVATGTRQSFTIGSAAPGVYEYHVVVKAVTLELIGFDLRASANSDPRIIID
jgi:hypothetical protein